MKNRLHRNEIMLSQDEIMQVDVSIGRCFILVCYSISMVYFGAAININDAYLDLYRLI